jgi:hypothetical protein
MTTQGNMLSEAAPQDGNIIVNNAGLVLFNPFLTMLFNMCGYLHEQAFKDEDSVHRAAHLLQFVATGTEDAGESDLSLNKLLCGIPVSSALKVQTPLLDAEKELARQMLRAVIGQWTILGQTSPEGLRDAFVMREGQLKLTPDLHTLTVAKRPYDMLIDKIPWVFSVIKLHWMPKPLHTRWR